MNPKNIDKKLADLKAYRRARGLCNHCSDKWSHDHKCAAQVSLHVLDELYALFSTDDTVDGPTTEADDAPESEEQCCYVSATTTAQSGAKTLRFLGHFHHQPVLIMIDSGSSSSFISTQLVSELSLVTTSCATVSVRVANGKIQLLFPGLFGVYTSFNMT